MRIFCNVNSLHSNSSLYSFFNTRILEQRLKGIIGRAHKTKSTNEEINKNSYTICRENDVD